MGLLDRISASRVEHRSSIDTWLSQYLIPATQFGYGGIQYQAGGLNQTWQTDRRAEITATLPSYTAALQQCPPAFAAQMVRALVLSQVRFTFRNRPWTKTPRRLFGTTALNLLENPWRNATTGELVSRMEWHAGLAGNAFVYRRPDRLRVLRPDWTAILYGSELEPDDPGHAIDGDVLGYVYWNGGPFGGYKPTTILPGDMAHWSPLPDPLSPGQGMSWVTPAIRDIQGDRLASEHKIRYFENGATPNLVVKGLAGPNGQQLTEDQFSEIVGMLDRQHTGVANAYRTLYLTAGADASVVGSNLAELDLKSVQGANETRISFLSRVPAPILGIAEGLAGSSLNAGNFGMARRIFADSWVYPTLQDLAAALAPLVRVPELAELWFDVADMPLLREDAKDAADIAQVRAQAIRTLADGGYDPDGSTATVAPDWASTLKHSGKLSVQLQEPGAGGVVTKSDAERAALAAGQQGRAEAAVAELRSQLAELGARVQALQSESHREREARQEEHTARVVAEHALRAAEERNAESSRSLAEAVAQRSFAEATSRELRERGDRLQIGIAERDAEIRLRDAKIAQLRDAEVRDARALAAALSARSGAEPNAAGTHTGMVSVQMQTPGAEPSDGGVGPKAPDGIRAVEPTDELDEDSLALLTALRELSETRAFNPAEHPRNPKGSPGGGRFRSLVDRLKDAIEAHTKGNGDGDPFDGFSREQLRRVAKARGIDLKRGEDRDSIAKKILAHLGVGRADGVSGGRHRTGEDALRAAPIAMGRHGFIRGVDGDLEQEIDSEALDMYRGPDYEDINAALRGGDKDAYGQGWVVDTMDYTLENSKLTAPVVTYRGISDLSFLGDTSRSLLGLEYVEDAYVSTTADRTVATEFFRQSGAVLTVKVPAGIGAIQLSDIGPAPGPGQQRSELHEAELLLQRGLRYRVTADRRPGGVREIEVEVVPA